MLIVLDLFYRIYQKIPLHFQVYVCSCLADLRITTANVGGSEATTSVLPDTSWSHLYTGVPVIVLNTGTGRRKRAVHLVVAERETGFPLWSDRINYLTNYASRTSSLHAFHVSTSLRSVAGLQFYSVPAAARFYERFRVVTSDPDDELWAVSGSTQGRRRRRKKLNKQKQQAAKAPSLEPSVSRWKRSSSAKVKRVTKPEISHPCHFVHVTTVHPGDQHLMEAFSDYLKNHKKKVDALGGSQDVMVEGAALT